MLAQRQNGFSTATVKITRGDLTPEQMRGLAGIMRDFTGGYARTTVQQNLVLRWIRNEALYDLWTELRELDLGAAGAREIEDVVSCPGTDSCKLGITSSMGLNKAVQERIEALEITDELTKKIHVKMSGCPNGCSQHHIANIGFYGASLKIGDRQLPAYIPHIGGNYEGGDVVMGKRLKSRIPAKRVPEAVERWIELYQGERNDGEEFNAFVERVGTATFEETDLRPDAAGRVLDREPQPLHRLEPQGRLQGRARRGRVRDMTDANGNRLRTWPLIERVEGAADRRCFQSSARSARSRTRDARSARAPSSRRPTIS